MPLIASAVAAYAAGLVAGFHVGGPLLLAGAGLAAAAGIGWAALRHRTPGTPPIGALVFALGVAVARDAPPPAAHPWPAAAQGPLAGWREQAGASIDSLFGTQAPTVRALLIADTRQIPADLRDRYARSGLVHVLSISGLHVAIIAGAVVLALQLLRVPAGVARWLAAGLTALYVAAIGAPPPALRSGAMLGAATLARSLQRPVSPWATLAIGALIPLLLDPRTVSDLGFQLSVTGFAALTAGTIWARRALPADLRGVRRTLVADLAASALVTLATAPLVAWHFARVSLVAPLAGLAAAPIVAVMQPALFLALVLAPTGGPAQIAADGAGVLVRALDAVAAAGAAVPGASLPVAPSLAAALLGGAAVTCLVGAAAARRRRTQWGVAGAAALAAMVWWPLAPRPPRGMELHLLDVGQGDAIAVRTPRGRWIVVDAGGGRGGGDAGRRIVTPYLRRLGGDVALFVMTHPHDDHVGGAASLIAVLRPAAVRDAAFAGTSASYREALEAARRLGVPWQRVRPGDSITVDGVVATFLAPDSAWTASLTDPNLASAVVRVRYGRVRALLTGDAEAPEESWLLARDAGWLEADVLKVAHHGSRTSTTDAWLDAVRPTLALLSVGRNNRYAHPSPEVIRALRVRRIRVVRTDRDGTVVVRTDRDGTAIASVTTSGAP